MSFEVIAILILLTMFVVGAMLPINLGIMGFVAAFVVGSLISGMKVADIFRVFPADLFVTLAGVTYLFAIVQNNGTVDLITKWGLRMVRGNRGLIPWVMFALSTLLTSVGTLGPATVAILAPIALRFAAQYSINPILMGVLVVNGSVAGYYSPLNPLGLIVNGMMEKVQISHSPAMLFANGLIFCTIVSALVFAAFGGFRLLKSTAAVQAADEIATAAADHSRNREDGFTLYKGVTLAGIVILVVLALAFQVHIGFAAFAIALVLALLAPKKQAGVLGRMPWSVILMISGIVTFVGVLEKIGAVDYVTELIASVKNPVVAALAASYVGGIVSSFASTTGFLAAIIPLAAPIIQDPTISSMGVISAICIATGIVDVSPFSTNGSLILANAQGVEERVFFRQLLIVSALLIAFGPGLAWAIFVLIGG
jgi:Na+/H+ antiporter NhaD/arsenite permease-like protein